MITLELNEKVVENYKAAETLKEFGFNDHEIQEMIDRQNDKDKVNEKVTNGKPKTITEQIQEVAADFCGNYCKYPDIRDEEAEGYDLSESDRCQNCPLNRL